MEAGTMTLAGFTDEAADPVDGQLRAVSALGWKWIEARNVDGINVHDLGDREFDTFRSSLERAGVGVCCLGSSIANWGKSVDEDFAASMAIAGRAAQRMQALGTRLVRIMSYRILFDAEGNPLADQKKQKRFERLKELCAVFTERGITPVHENCLNYGGMGVANTLELLSEVPGLRLVFDTGNPALTPDFSKPRPWPNQDAFESWLALRDHVVHLHVKDGWRDPESGEETYSYPGEGRARVREILEDCLATGYSGWLTIEPHMAVVYHDPSVSSPAEKREALFIEYGRRLETMLRSLGCEVADGTVKKARTKGTLPV
jgi:sugar phosphate isomerase/epimerase